MLAAVFEATGVVPKFVELKSATYDLALPVQVPVSGQIYVGGRAPGSECPRFIIARVAPRVAHVIVALPLVALAHTCRSAGYRTPSCCMSGCRKSRSCTACWCNRQAAKCTSRSCSAGYRRSSGRMGSEHTPQEWRSAPHAQTLPVAGSAVVTLPVYRPLSET